MKNEIQREKWFCIVVVLIIVLASAGFFGSLINDFDSPVGYWIMMAIHAVVIVVIVWFMARNYILVDDSNVKVCFGPTNSVVEIASIVSMKKVFNVVASSGASAHRIEITFKKGNERKLIYISPKDQDGFIETVSGKNPDIKVF